MAFTVTATQAGTVFTTGVGLQVEVLTNTAATQNGASATSVTAYQVAITTTTTGSVVYGAVSGSAASLTANANTTIIAQAAQGASQYGACKATSATGTPGAITLGATNAYVNGGVALFEILPNGTITLDGSTPAFASANASAATTASFSPPPGSLLVALVTTASTLVTFTDTSGLGLTWTQVALVGSDGVNAVYIAQMPGAPGGMPQPGGQTWRRQFRRHQVASPPPPPAPPVAGSVQPLPTRQIPRFMPRRARIGVSGLCAAGLLGAMAPAGHTPPPTGVHTTPGRGPSRAHAGPRGLPGTGNPGPFANRLSITPQPHPAPPRSPAPRRAQAGPAGLPAAGVKGANAVLTFVAVGPPAWKPQPRRPPGARASWRGYGAPAPVPRVAVGPPPQVTQPRRRPGSRVLWRGNPAAFPVVPGVAVKAPKQLTQPRRPPGARALWRGEAGPQPVVAPPVFDHLPATPAYPLPLLDTRVELNLAGTWTDITSYVYERAPVTIIRGHADEQTTTTPSSATMTINNRDGRFSDLNAVGPWYGQIGQNTPLRISVPEGAAYLRSEVDQVSYAQCPDTAGISITGDMELQLDMSLDNWNGSQLLAAKWAGSGQASWLLLLWNDGTLQFQYSQDGTSINAARTTATIPYPPLRRMSLRVTLAVATGTVTYYTGPPGLSGPSWTQLGPAIVLGANNVFDSTAALQLGYGPSSGTGFPGIAGKIHAAQLLSGIAGTVKASPDFTAQAPGTTSFSDAQSNAWSLLGTAEISNRKYRYHGEVSAWPQSWDPTGTDVTTEITASGILRRLGANAGGQLFTSAMYRAYVRLAGSTAPVAYWPAEDGAAATQIASGLGGPPMQVTVPPQYGGNSAFLCSNPIPTLVAGSTWSGSVPAYSGGTDNVLRFLMQVPAGGDTNGGIIARMFTTGTIARADLVYGTGGTMTVKVYDASGALLNSFTPAAFGLNGELVRVSLELQASGGNISCNAVTIQVGASSGLASSNTQTAASVGNVTQVVFNPGGLLTSTAIGQISVQPVWTSLFDLGSPLAAWQGEAAGVRFKRLCAEESISFRGQGNLAATVLMGPQLAAAVPTLLQQCADADLGAIAEPRQVFGLGYRTRGSMLNQPPAVTLSYTAAHLSDELRPTRDDQQLRNDVTVSQGAGASSTAGSSSEQVLASGPLSVQAPPAGAGRYAVQATINVATAGQLDSVAGWLLHMGTVNQPRYPLIQVNLERPEMAAVYWALQDMDLGDYLQVTGTPLWLPPDGINQLLQGATEVVYGYVFHEAWACIPQSPWNTAVSDDLVWGRYDTDGSTLHANISSGATSMLVDTATATSPLWTTSAGDFPFDVLMSGERITVTNITGSSSPQTFTITRSVNGVVKAQTASTDVRLFFPPIYSL